MTSGARLNSEESNMHHEPHAHRHERRCTGCGARTLVLLASAAIVFAMPVVAQTPAPIGIGLATYTGADRMQRLIEGAKKEGEVSIYTSAPVDDMKALGDLFEKKYGVKVKLWRASSENVLQRGVTETRANRNTADVFETNGPEMEALAREKILTPVTSPTLGDLIAEAKFKHGAWVGSR